MDPALIRFRQAANRENGRRALRRRYSPTLQEQAVEYWRQHYPEEGVRTIAAALGLAPTTLQRWTRVSQARPRSRPIEFVTPEPAAGAVPVVITMTVDGPRLEGLPVETAARVLTGDLR